MSKKTSMTSTTALTLMFGDSAEELVSPSTIFVGKVFLISLLVSGAMVYWTSVLKEAGNQADAFAEACPKVVNAIKAFIDSFYELKNYFWPKAVSIEIQTDSSVPSKLSDRTGPNRLDKLCHSRITVE